MKHTKDRIVKEFFGHAVQTHNQALKKDVRLLGTEALELITRLRPCKTAHAHSGTYLGCSAFHTLRI